MGGLVICGGMCWECSDVERKLVGRLGVVEGWALLGGSGLGATGLVSELEVPLLRYWWLPDGGRRVLRAQVGGRLARSCVACSLRWPLQDALALNRSIAGLPEVPDLRRGLAGRALVRAFRRVDTCSARATPQCLLCDKLISQL